MLSSDGNYGLDEYERNRKWKDWMFPDHFESVRYVHDFRLKRGKIRKHTKTLQVLKKCD